MLIKKNRICIQPIFSQTRTLTQGQQLNNGGQERSSFLEPTNRILETISTHPGDYSQRDIDTRTKETPSTKDLEEINQGIKLLMARYEVTPTQNAFGFLWLANFVLYSMVCASDKITNFGGNVLAPCTRVWSRASKKFLRATKITPSGFLKGKPPSFRKKASF